MSWPSPIYRRVQGVPEHLQNFGEQLRELAIEVRSSVAGLTGEAVGRAVRDVLLRFWHRSPGVPIIVQHDSMQHDPFAWPNTPVDGWDRDQPHWHEPGGMPPRQGASGFPAAKAALALQAAGWMLHSKGSWLGAMGLGLAIGGLAFFGGRTLAAGAGLLDAAVDLTTLVGLLASGAKLLRTV